MSRDPRIDPRPGDVLRVVDGDEWAVCTVYDVSDRGVYFSMTEAGKWLGPYGVLPEKWREVAAGATVLHPIAASGDGAP